MLGVICLTVKMYKTVCVVFNNVGLRYPDMCEQILKQNQTQSDVFMVKGTVHLMHTSIQGID